MRPRSERGKTTTFEKSGAMQVYQQAKHGWVSIEGM
jgi:hypothetical protein